MGKNKDKISRNKYISLQGASKLCPYSQEYLSLRARQGKLKAIKKGRNWMTTRPWLNEYVSSTQHITQYVSLQTAAKLCPYSQEYLSLRARQGKLKAIKLKGKWVTTQKWLNDYIQQIRGEEGKKGLFREKEVKEVVKKPFWPDFLRNIPARVGKIKLEKILEKIIGQPIDKGLAFIDGFVRLIHQPKFVLSTLFILLTLLLISSILLFVPQTRQAIQETSQQLDIYLKETQSHLTDSFQQAPASFLESFSHFNQQLFQKITATSQSIQDKLGDSYIKLAEFLVPGYSLDPSFLKMPEQLMPGQRRIVKIEEPVIYEIVKQVQQLTPQVITKEVTKEITQITQITETIAPADLTAINQRITNLASQISSKIDYTVPSYAPIYIPSSGLQVSGHALLSTLNVSGSGSVGGSFDVHDNAAFGNTKDTRTVFDVYSDATFHESVNFDKGLSAASLSTSGDLTVSGDGTITGTFSAATSTLAQLTITNDLLISGNATTTGSHYVGGDLTVAGAFNQSGAAAAFATTTITGDLTVQDSDGTAHLYVENNTGNIGIGTTTPDYKLSVVGGMFASTTSNQLTLAYDLQDSDYGTFSVGSDGDLTIDLATSNSTTTFSDNVSILGYLNVEGSATTTGSHYIGNDLTVMNGNVGIGTTSPDEILHIEGTDPIIKFVNSSGGNSGFGLYNQSLTKIGEVVIDNTVGDIHLSSLNTTDAMVIKATTGNVGIGTTTPESLLTVDGNGYIDGSFYIAADIYGADQDGVLNLGRNSSAWESLTWDDSDSQFELSDDLEVTGYASTTAGLFTQGDIHAGTNATIDGTLDINTIAAGASDYDKFLVSDSGVVKYRTGAQVLSDIGGDNYVSWTIADHDNDTYTITSGDTLKLAEGTGIDVDGTADDVITISGKDATVSTKGIASFSDSYFSVSSGAVSIDDKYVLNTSDTMSGSLSVGTTLGVTGATTLTGLLTANGGITADSGAFTVANTSGNIHTSGTLDVDGLIYAGTSAITLTNAAGYIVETAIAQNSLDDSEIEDNILTAASLAAGSVTVAGGELDAGYAGAGLTGGGASALAVGAGTCITVNANDVAVTTNCVDATTLDSIDSGSFLRSDVADVYNDAGANIDLRFEGDTDPNLLFLDASADSVGIGVIDPDTKLEVYSSGTQLKLSYNATNYGTITTNSTGEMQLTGNSGAGGNVIVDSGSNMGIGNNSPSYLLTMEASGGGYYSAVDHQWHDGSTRAIKQDITSITSEQRDDLLTLLDNLEINQYRFISDYQEYSEDAIWQYGIIADDGPELLTGHNRDSIAGGSATQFLLMVNQTILRKVQDLENGLSIDETGNVGIGTTSPAYQLEVNGDVGIDGDLTVQGQSLFEGPATTTSSFYIAGDLNVQGSSLFQGESLNIIDWNETYNWGNHAEIGYLTFYTETDSIFASSTAASITSASTTNWNLAYSWGDHANQNYFIKGTDSLNDIVPGLYYSAGNIGIGQALPSAKLSVQGTAGQPIIKVTSSTGQTLFYLGQSGNVSIGTATSSMSDLSAQLTIQSSGITASTTALSIINASSSPLLYLVDNGYIGIATITPTNILTIAQGMGNAIADGWDVYSSQEYKTEITYLEKKDYDDILDEIEGIKVARYQWKDSGTVPLGASSGEDTPNGTVPSDSLNLGVIAEEAPEEVLSKDGKSISLYDYTTFALAGVKAVKNELEELKELLNVLENEDGSLALLKEEIEPVIITGDNGQQFQLAVDKDGYVVLDKLKVRDLEIVQGGQLTLPQGEDEIISEGMIATSSDYVIIKNNKVLENSKIFASFTTNLNGASWWICDKTVGDSFKVCLSQQAEEKLNFDYWIVQAKNLDDQSQAQISVDNFSDSTDSTDSTEQANQAQNSDIQNTEGDSSVNDDSGGDGSETESINSEEEVNNQDNKEGESESESDTSDTSDTSETSDTTEEVNTDNTDTTDTTEIVNDTSTKSAVETINNIDNDINSDSENNNNSEESISIEGVIIEGVINELPLR